MAEKQSNLPLEKLTCQSCNKLYEHPRVLPCLHIMCKACIEALKPSKDGGVCCPLCETPALLPQEDVTKLPTASFISNMIDVTQTLKRAHENNIVCDNCCSKDATAYCTDCALFQCEDCCKSHDVLKVLKEHKVTTIKELDRCNFCSKAARSMCSKHMSRKLELYCCSCEGLVCYECGFLEHPQPQHQVKRLKDCVTPFKDDVCKAVTSFVQGANVHSPGEVDVSGEMDSLVRCERELQVAMEMLKDKGRTLLECDRKLKISVEGAFHDLVKFIRYKETEVQDKINKLFDDRLGDSHNQTRQMELLQIRIGAVQRFVKCLEEHSCDEEFVSMKHLVCARIEQLREEGKRLQQRLDTYLKEVPSASCSTEPMGACHLTVTTTGGGILFDARLATSFPGSELQPAVTGASPHSPPSIPEGTAAADKAPGSSQGQVSSINGSGGASSYDLSNIIAAVSTISGQWKELGSGLGLQPVILDAIQGPPEVCMVEMIKHWVHGAMAASRQRLSSALGRMGRIDLAEGVMAGVECGSTSSALDDVTRGPPLKPLHTMPLTNLSPDVLYLLEKLPDGDIEGVVYKPSECTAIIQGPTPEAVDECVTKFQSAYQKTMSPAQFKAEDIQLAPTLDSNIVLYLVAILNSRHNQCVFIHMEEKHLVRLICSSPRHFDTAMKDLKEFLDRAKSSKHKPPLFVMKICGHRVLTLKQRDIVAEDVEVIVNAANEHLSHGSGVAGALDKASGGGLQDVSNAYIAARGPVQIGDVAVTASGGGALKCKRVYHVVGPKAEDYTPKDCRRLIEQIVKKVLVTAEKNGILSIAFPAISSGIYGVPKELVAEVIIDTIINHQFTSRPSVLGDIRIVIIDIPTFDCFAKYFNQRKKGVTSIPTVADGVKRGNIGTTSGGAVGDITYPNLNNGDKYSFQGGGHAGYSTPVDNPPYRRTDLKADATDNCPICLNPPQNSVIQECCHKAYCRACLDEALKSSPYCPTCKKVLRGGAMGNQPDGTMNIEYGRTPLPGYPGCGTFVITYYIPDGTQGPQHPNPGQRYTGTRRTAFLPENQEGREVLKLLQKAWDAKLIFTIGTSHTTGEHNVVVWNDIHHKTNINGGAYGYPDYTYLRRVKEELAAKGIRPD